MLIRGKAKSLLDDSISNALMAVELYNKPKLDGRINAYIIHMIIAWTKIMHAYFYKTIGDKYYYKKNNKYVRIDGEKRTWELNECIKKYHHLLPGEKENINFFIKLRNKIEHSFIDCTELEIKIFGECQSLLYNYENFVIKNFGVEYSLNISLPFSLQFSQLRNKNSLVSSKKLLSKEMVKINEFIEAYKSCIPNDIFNTQEYSIKLIQIPKVSNTTKNDLSIQFVNWELLDEEEKTEINKITTLIKDKNTIVEIANFEKYLPGKIKTIINEKYLEFNINYNTYLAYVFSVRPFKKREKDKDAFETNSKYCIYDETHNDYLYTDEWINFIFNFMEVKKIELTEIKNMYFKNQKLDILEYE